MTALYVWNIFKRAVTSWHFGFLGSFVALNSVLPINSAEPKVSISETGVQTWVIFGSIVVAFMALMVTSYHHDRTQKFKILLQHCKLLGLTEII